VKRLSMRVFLIVLGCAATVVLTTAASRPSHFVGSAVNEPTDAAFRDGEFQGRLDVERGKKRHLSIGRWNLDSDRRLFVSGYLRAYRKMSGGQASEQSPVWQLAEQRGYHDGLKDGLRQRREAKRFQPNAKENYRRAAQGYSDNMGDLNQYKQLYREAYCTGYQQGYYGEAEKIETAKFSRPGDLE
jgi:hypothetical protein